MRSIRRSAAPIPAASCSQHCATSLSTSRPTSRSCRSSPRAWEWAADGKSITFTLRKNVTFHDGTAFDAAAVKFNIERMKTMPDSKRKAELAPIATVEVLAADKVKFNLSEPFVPLLANLSDRAGMMVSPKAAGEKAGEFAAAPVCAGPYQFVERKSRDLIRVKKYPGYWNAGQIGYDEIVYSYVPDSTVRLSRVRAGDLDLAERIAPTDLKTVRDDANLALHSGQGLAVAHLMFNVGAGAKADTPLGKNATLRQAFELAIDRTVINKVAFNGEFRGRQPDDPAVVAVLRPGPQGPGARRRQGQGADRRRRHDPGADGTQLREHGRRYPRRADHAVDGGRGRLRRQAAADGDGDRDRALSERQFRSLYRQLERPRRSRIRR